MNEKKRPLPHPEDIPPVLGEPADVWEQVNKYGTYEVQDTTDTDNVFPTIGYEGSWKNGMDALNSPTEKKKTKP